MWAMVCEMNDFKIIISKRQAERGKPPSKSVGSIEIGEGGFYTESEIIDYIYNQYGCGEYTLLWISEERNKFSKCWKGAIFREEDNIYSKTIDNKFENTPVKKESYPGEIDEIC
jgi:hypothetical protein